MPLYPQFFSFNNIKRDGITDKSGTQSSNDTLVRIELLVCVDMVVIANGSRRQVRTSRQK
jgi:hypothetical protein